MSVALARLWARLSDDVLVAMGYRAGRRAIWSHSPRVSQHSKS